VKGTPSYEMNGLTVSAKGPYGVVVKSDVANPGLPALMASTYFSILNSAVVKANGGTDAADASTADKAQSYLDTHSAGSGPYTLTQYTPQATVILKANPKFWGKKPAYDQVVLKNVPASTQLLEVEKGTAQLAVDLSPDQVASTPGNVKVTRHPSATFFFLEANLDSSVSPVAANKTFQQAIRYAIDYKNIVQLVGKGATQISGFIPSVIAGSLPAKWANKRDVAKAKALIQRSGVTNPTLTLEYPNDFTLNGLSFGTIAQRIQSQLAEVGIKVQLAPGPLATTLANWRAGKEELGLWTTTPDYPAPYTYLDFCPGGNHAIRTKWMAGQDKALEKLCSQAAATSMTAKNFDKLFTLVQRKLLAEGPYYPLFQPAQVIVSSNSVTNITYSPTTFVDIRSIGHK
jgi:peptide/nickel transport system substrate-binding protein